MCKMGLTIIQNMTSADALSLLTPYDDTNANTTSHLFLDIDDGYTLKGIFFDDTEPLDKVIKTISTGLAGASATMLKATITQAGVVAPVVTELANTTGIDVTADFTYSAVGKYNIASVGAFADLDKVCVNFGAGQVVDVDFSTEAVDDDNLLIVTRTGGANTDGLMTNTPFSLVIFE